LASDSFCYNDNKHILKPESTRRVQTSADDVMANGFWYKVFTGQMPFLSPNQQRQSTKGNFFGSVKDDKSVANGLFDWKTVAAKQQSNKKQLQ